MKQKQAVRLYDEKPVCKVKKIASFSLAVYLHTFRKQQKGKKKSWKNCSALGEMTRVGVAARNGQTSGWLLGLVAYDVTVVSSDFWQEM